MKNISQLIESALVTGSNQHTALSLALGIKNKSGRAILSSSEDIIFSGCDFIKEAVKQIDPSIDVKWYFKDGDFLLEDQTICLFKGNLLNILKIKDALSFVNHLSGLATLTKCYVNIQESNKLINSFSHTTDLETPEQKAFFQGQGLEKKDLFENCFLITNEHIQIAGDLKKTISQCRNNQLKPLQLEISKTQQFQFAKENQIKYVYLNQLSIADIKIILSQNTTDVKFEVSAPMDLDYIKEVSGLSIHAISIDDFALSAPNTKIKLKIEEV